MGNEAWAVVAVLAVGFVAGILSGMFGIGGGLVIVPALVLLFEFPTETAVGHLAVRPDVAGRRARRPGVLERGAHGPPARGS